MNRIRILYPDTIGIVDPKIYGVFIEQMAMGVYGSLWVGEGSPVPNIRGWRRDFIEAFRRVRPAAIRWPGGIVGDHYRWRDGIGPREKRPVRANWNSWVTGQQQYDDNAVGTHEFLDLCRLVGAEPYIAMNVVSDTVLSQMDYLDYCNTPDGTANARERIQNGAAEPFNVKYWGLGCEMWGASGNMSPEDFCEIYRRYAISLKLISAHGECLIAGGADGNCWGPARNDAPAAQGYAQEWTRRFFTKFFKNLDHMPQRDHAPLAGYSIHYYGFEDVVGNDVEFTQTDWYRNMRIALNTERLIREQRAVLDGWDPERRIGLVIDEWGAWHRQPEKKLFTPWAFYQTVTMRDAVYSAISLNIFNNHCDSILMANCSELMNVLNSLFHAEGDRFGVTPVYHVFDMMQTHQGARCIRTLIEADETGGVPEVSVSATEKDGRTSVTLVSLRYEGQSQTELCLYDGTFSGTAERVTLTAAPNAYNAYDAPDSVRPIHDTLRAEGSRLTVTLPPASVTTLLF